MLWLVNCFPAYRKKPPSVEAYRKACLKTSITFVEEVARISHTYARTEKDRLYHGMRVIIVDGTKIIVPRTEETIKVFGLSSGSTGDAYYPQTHANGFFDLVTGTFRDMVFAPYASSERDFMRIHAQNNEEPTLYIGDAGYNGMAHVYFMRQTGHHLLMELRMGKLAKRFRKSRKRSQLIEITLNRSHLKNYPEYHHLIGKTFVIRLIRTKGTSKLRSKILLTTLIDEETYHWLDLAKLYLQRGRIELAFRHLKVSMRIEHIRKCSLLRIKQLLWGTIILFNLCCIIRNSLKSPTLFPERSHTKMYCFEFIVELADVFFIVAIKHAPGLIKEVKRRLKAMKNCWFLYQPWRIRPRLCQFPPSTLTRQKYTTIIAEYKKCNILKNEMRLLGMKYGQIKPFVALSW